VLKTLLRYLKPKQTVRIYADFIDPFCYVGVHNLLLELPREWNVDWRGFEFNPGTPSAGMALVPAGNSDLRAGMWPSVSAYAAKSGLHLEIPEFVPNTRLAHALVMAAPRDVKNPLIARIYQAYLSDRKNLGERAILADFACEFEFSIEKVYRMETDGSLERRLERHRREAAARKFHGMPGFAWSRGTSFGALPRTYWKPIFETS
jgi:predicted DsbA family dithiol-disulfide isomerase